VRLKVFNDVPLPPHTHCSVRARLVGGYVTWRTVLIGTLIIASMLLNMAWQRAIDGNDDRGYTVAMNTCVATLMRDCVRT